MTARTGTIRRMLTLAVAIAVGAPGIAASEGAEKRPGASEMRSDDRALVEAVRGQAPPGSVRVTRDGGKQDRPAVRSPEEYLRRAGDPRSPASLAAAARAMIEDHWNVTLPDVRARAGTPGVPLSHELGVGTIRIGLPGGDLSGDELEDALVLEYSTGRYDLAVSMIRAVAGTDGAELWTKYLGSAYDAYPLRVGDLDGDGTDDVLLLQLTFDPVGVGGCAPFVACAFGGATTFAWTFELLSGADGKTVWSRRFDGHIAEMYGFDYAPTPTFNFAYAAAAENIVVLPLLSDDHDGDGVRDIVFDAFDAILVYDVNGVFGLAAFAYAGVFASLVQTKAEIAGGADGRPFFERVQSFTPGGSVLLPAGDAVGGSTSDLVWEERSEISSPFACAFALLVGGACAQYTKTSLTLEMIDGRTLTSAWKHAVPSKAPVTFADPAAVDLTGDGRADILLISSEDGSFVSGIGVVSGADGTRAWHRVTEGYPIPIGPVAGGDGHDLLVIDFGYDEYYDAVHPVVLSRVNGATGTELFQTTHAMNADAAFYDVMVSLVGDGDGDGTSDVAIDFFVYDYVTDASWSLLRVESGASGGVLFERTTPDAAVGLAAGDLDADGRDDLVDLVASWTDVGVEVRFTAVALASGHALWTRTDLFEEDFGLSLVPTPDQVGSGGADAIYNRVQFTPTLVSRVDGVDGRTGSFTWGVGPAFPEPQSKGAIAGVVRNASGEPAAFVCVDVFTADGFFVRDESTGTDGSYLIDRLTAGSYRVRFEDCYEGTASEWYDDKESFELADEVMVVAGQTTSGIDAVLEATGGPDPTHPPGNDNVADATEVARIPFADIVETHEASLEEQEPQPSCAPTGATAWYRYTADADGVRVISTSGSTFDTTLAVYAGSGFADFEEVACSDDVTELALTSAVAFAVTAGTTYYVQAGGYEADTGLLNVRVY